MQKSGYGIKLAEMYALDLPRVLFLTVFAVVVNTKSISKMLQIGYLSVVLLSLLNITEQGLNL